MLAKIPLLNLAPHRRPNLPLKKIVASLGVLAVTCLLWFIPMLWMSGGWNAYQEARSKAIGDRITEVHVERIYRILGNLEKKVREIEQRTVPELRQRLRPSA